MIEKTHALVLAGGSGTRFWPVSRMNRPKQFLDVLGIGKTLLQATIERVNQLLPLERIWLSANQQHQHLIETQTPHIPPERRLYEPLQRNTAPSILYAVEVIARQFPEALMWILPADHFIPDQEEFLRLIESIINNCDFSEAIFTIGIRPSHPHTGYGYIQFIPKPTLCKPVKTFTEKPSKELAELFIQSGDFLWNSGMFLARAAVLKEAFSQFAPDLYEIFSDMDLSDPSSLLKAFQQAPAISFDYAIMEKYPTVMVIEGNFRWWDLGGWNAIHEVSPHDQWGNSSYAQVRTQSVKECLFFSDNPKKIIVAEGLSGYLIIDTADALLILPRSQEQSIRDWVQRLRTEGNSEYL
ncbi:MAG: sugar phosphate nucleotidyltransferase [Bacteroidia bacterium]|nr:sugar phosphate nucleotidyltransferase [Bacteroidia bacterium]MCX7652862.1 sugar phosphate nucleotidyltransferase [Bacteroidia bacterium]MDW8417488.1 mannose-1-phosphate guanylyltransferase [Bacteroidia bacterium]